MSADVISSLSLLDVTLLPVCEEEVSLEQQERSINVVQLNPEPPQIKEEQEELLQKPEEAGGSTLTLLKLTCNTETCGL